MDLQLKAAFTANLLATVHSLIHVLALTGLVFVYFVVSSE